MNELADGRVETRRWSQPAPPNHRVTQMENEQEGKETQTQTPPHSPPSFCFLFFTFSDPLQHSAPLQIRKGQFRARNITNHNRLTCCRPRPKSTVCFRSTKNSNMSQQLTLTVFKPLLCHHFSVTWLFPQNPDILQTQTLAAASSCSTSGCNFILFLL